jgi:hypothetical protein
MRGPAHRNPTVDADPPQLESRGRITSRLHFSGRHQQTMQMGFTAVFHDATPLHSHIGRLREHISPHLSAHVQKTIEPRSVKSPTGTLLVILGGASPWIHSLRRRIVRRLRLRADSRLGSFSLRMKDQIRLIAKAVWRHRYYQRANLRHRISRSDYLSLKMGLYRNVILQTVSIYLDGRRKRSRVLSLYASPTAGRMVTMARKGCHVF